jgi:O-methyltransferase
VKPLHLYFSSRRLRTAIFSVCQDLLVRVPLASEMRLGADRVLAFLRAWHYLYRAKVAGDYLEFGVAEGLSFKLALVSAARFHPRGAAGSPRFFAFDSFAGLPPPDPSRDGTIWRAGEIDVPRAVFEDFIARAARGWDVTVVPGFYSETLTPDLRRRVGLERAAFVTIDCDLYGSTLEALRFVTPLLQTGTLIYFDDWYFSHGDLSLGEAGACRAWLAENPGISLADYGDVGIMAKMFLVQREAIAAGGARAM